MKEVFGEGLKYLFLLAKILFSSVLFKFADSFSDHVTFIIDVLVYDGLNKIWSLEVRPSSELTPAFACRN